MSIQLFLCRARWSPDAFRGVVNSPHDRTEPVRKALAVFGIELMEMLYSPTKGEMIVLVKGEFGAMNAYNMAVQATGNFGDTSFEPAQNVQKMLGTMEFANERSHAFEPPSRDEIDRMLLDE